MVEFASPVTSVSMVDGHVSAVMVGQCSILLNEWPAKLFGEHGRIATATRPTMATIMTITRRFSRSSRGLSPAPDKHASMFQNTDDEMVSLRSWCMKFVGGMELLPKVWLKLSDLEPVEHTLPLPILLCCIDPLRTASQRA